MPAFLVHGVPDTARLWDPLRAHLARRDVIAPSLPGFGTPRPAGFTATKEAYVDWLIAEIDAVGAPVDLVGHDWGAILVQRVVSLRPDLVRTWACGNGVVDEAYVWHPFAQQLQTPEVGEQIIGLMQGDDAAQGLVAGGMPAAVAAEVVTRIDATMQACILALYRSAVHVGQEWQAGVARASRPALVVWAGADPFVAPEFGERLAARVHGELLALEGCGHWWPVERAAVVAAALERFWAAA